MRRLILALGAVAFFLAALWALGGLTAARLAIVEAQRAFQADLAGGVRALKAGTPGAALSLAGLGFVYGVLHAVGPGHGKVVMGAWAWSTRASLWRVVAITVIASLAQATTAIVIVLAGALIFDLGREALTGIAEGPVTTLGNLVIAGLGAWLVLRGVRGFWRMDRVSVAHAGHHHDHGHHHRAQDHHHAHGAECDCGHAHTPDLEASAKATLPEALALIAGVALRPCTGAVFLMLLTWMIGAVWVGIAATYAMGLGTALVTLAVALTSTSLRGGLGEVGARHAGSIRVIGHGAELALGLLVIALVI
ncbi:nickel/cobalt transporter [Maritimibacter sp. DP1N21-5]|uniref:nickel/cobalt transporter n=1 Tax=Maritimibacter sp. DP1N21-5 TaxID=2836867 RepID=UPI001C47191F|nr:hypothetical protein [Maritimibacter sp. DP1N21-5]MBV7407618.1 hypothetical protein [Maritimibacter sp. DP1N21-5]